MGRQDVMTKNRLARSSLYVGAMDARIAMVSSGASAP